MPDVFVSYKKDDLPRVQSLVEALEGHGFSVWWDRRIPPGKTYPQVIKEHLDAARVVVVVWSAQSVDSEWVQIEATRGKRRGILVPAMIDPVADDVPLEFSLMEAADLTGWDGASSDPELEALVSSVAEIASAGEAAFQPEEATPGQIGSFIRARLARQERAARRPAAAAYDAPAGEPRIFISYRRDDARGHVERLYETLGGHFGADSVFMDVDTLQVGVDFFEVLRSAIARSTAAIAVIGPGWLESVDAAGRRRLDDPADVVRLELATAIREEIPLFPVLVGGGRMPAPSELPDELRWLAQLQALELRGAHWQSDVETLAGAVTASARARA